MLLPNGCWYWMCPWESICWCCGMFSYCWDKIYCAFWLFWMCRLTRCGEVAPGLTSPGLPRLGSSRSCRSVKDGVLTLSARFMFFWFSPKLPWLLWCWSTGSPKVNRLFEVGSLGAVSVAAVYFWGCFLPFFFWNSLFVEEPLFELFFPFPMLSCFEEWSEPVAGALLSRIFCGFRPPVEVLAVIWYSSVYWNSYSMNFCCGFSPSFSYPDSWSPSSSWLCSSLKWSY